MDGQMDRSRRYGGRVINVDRWRKGWRGGGMERLMGDGRRLTSFKKRGEGGREGRMDGWMEEAIAKRR